MKVGISMCDLTAGLHGVIGILAALRHAEKTGEGQHVDIGMLDVTVSMLANQGMNYLATKKRQPRLGNNHPNIVPYQVMPSSDGFFILSVGNNATFERFCQVASCEDLLQDARCSTAVARVTNRAYVTEKCNAVTSQKPTQWWLENLEKAKVGCSPILHPDEVFADPHVRARGMVVQMQLPGLDQPADVIASPMKFSKTKVNYRLPPPALGQHSNDVLGKLGYSPDQIAKMSDHGII
jgi:crotonobetainyl-CoA:carnitine CoA-transferase CaiB-like acyl-CoA transferase